MANPILIPFIIIIITIIIMKKITSHPFSKTLKNSPPSPPKLPILGNLHQFGSLVHRSLHRLSHRLGPIMLVHFGSRPVLIISSAAAAREVMRTHDNVFGSRPNFEGSNADKLFYHTKGISTSPYGEYWRQVRNICVLHLLCTKRVKSYRPIREEETTSLVKAITNLIQDGKMINMTEMFATLTYNVGSRVVLGKKYGDESEKKRLKGLTVELVGFLGSYSIGEFIPSLSWVNQVNGSEGRVRRLAKEIDEFLEVIVEEHANERLSKVKDEYEKDFVDVLLDFHEGYKKDASLDRDSVKALILDMFLGGTDTITTVLEWVVPQLLRHPKILKRLQAEVDQVAAGKPSISESDLDRMPYLKAVIKETLRLCPPFPLIVPRVTIQDSKVQGFDVAAGTWVIVNAWAVGRDSNVWDDPEEFTPERFLSKSNNNNNNNNNNNTEIDSFGSIAFGAGRRACPGALFASIVIEIVLASVVHKFDLELPNGNKVECLDMTEMAGFTIHRKVPLYCIAKHRSIVT